MVSAQIPPGLELRSHSTARLAAHATRSFAPGDVILVDEALTTAILPSDAGRRCNHCLRLTSDLKRCAGCAAYHYCSTQCQSQQWSIHHKRICKHISSFIASPAYQGLHEHEKITAVLLSHLCTISQHGKDSLRPALSTFEDLLPGPESATPPICPPPFSTEEQQKATYYHSKFGNNNFVIHSHLTSFAHGIFPMSSICFNHSCAPNAAARYILTPHQVPRMEVIALTHIAAGTEVTIPYLDPALPLANRQQITQITYGFICGCPLCTLQASLPAVPPPPPRSAQEDISLIDFGLRRLVFGATSDVSLPDTVPPLNDLPPNLLAVLHESYLPALSAAFSTASHDVESADILATALQTGQTILALYLLLYPRNYPQIGMHALEVAKTAWNGTVLDMPASPDDRRSLLAQAQAYLAIAQELLAVFGREGDEGGPLDEIHILKGLIMYEQHTSV
ncbi:SET domain-containing protein [Punctularia strigosozonata HHB-11173 SS5]|uniref:SET domain-containing protein n=1 Tax=Punctularia strigosozonata (strain HHB-11173) TaxID=741275 RepID=UPI0004418721|nr:SET domain-containing protein [Punctularia strigosozonata HHB-11173 SS5]EIN12756.1 SET domain-containing protein [Punctularia strigosozonata HHB-11173 SS5]